MDARGRLADFSPGAAVERLRDLDFNGVADWVVDNILVSVARGIAGELGAIFSTVCFAALDFLAVFRALGFGEFLALAVSALPRSGVRLPSGLCDGVRFFEAFVDDFGVADGRFTGELRLAVNVGVAVRIGCVASAISSGIA